MGLQIVSDSQIDSARGHKRPMFMKAERCSSPGLLEITEKAHSRVGSTTIVDWSKSRCILPVPLFPPDFYLNIDKCGLNNRKLFLHNTRS